jgi:hypothetical protein
MTFPSVFRVTAWFLIGAFLAEPIAQAAPEWTAHRPALYQAERRLPISESVARVGDAYQGSSDYRFYLLEDAHANPSGQRNLARTLLRLFEIDSKLSTVFVEAGQGDSALADLRTLGNPDSRRRLAERYLRSGELHGEEYLSLTADKPFEVWGVEDLALYARSVENYRDVVRRREALLAYLARIGSTQQWLEKRLAAPELASLLQTRRAYRRGEKGITEYFAALSDAAVFTGVTTGGYPSLARLEAVRDLEARIDFDSASREQARAFERLSDEDREALGRAQGLDAPRAGRFRPDDRAQDGFFACLEEKIPDLSIYPELAQYLNYRKTARSIDAETLLEESDRLEREVLGRLARSADERSLLEAADALEFWKALIALSVTPRQYEAGRAYLSPESIRQTTGFMNRKIMDFDGPYERALLIEP